MASGVTGLGLPVSVALMPVRRRSATGPGSATGRTVGVERSARETKLKLRYVNRVSLLLLITVHCTLVNSGGSGVLKSICGF